MEVWTSAIDETNLCAYEHVCICAVVIVSLVFKLKNHAAGPLSRTFYHYHLHTFSLVEFKVNNFLDIFFVQLFLLVYHSGCRRQGI